MAAFVGAFALFATPAEAGGRRHYKNYYNGDCYRGGGYRGGYGDYQPYYRPAAMGTIARCVIIDPHTTTRDRPFRSASPLVAAATAAKPHDNSVGGIESARAHGLGRFLGSWTSELTPADAFVASDNVPTTERRRWGHRRYKNRPFRSASPLAAAGTPPLQQAVKVFF